MSRSEADEWLTEDRALAINQARGRMGLEPLDRAMMAMMISRLDDQGVEEMREKYDG